MLGDYYMDTLKILKEELMRVYSSKTFDALLPPIVFVLAQNIFDLKIGLITAVSIATLIALYRIIKGDKLTYALAGIIGVALTGGYAYYMGNAKSYFLPKLITSGLGALVSFLSILFKRPLAAYLSHISRSWPLKWFWRKDVKPAYNEVTFAWAILFSLRLLILFSLYNTGEVSQLLIINFILGTPATIITLLLTYLYGSYRLKTLKGPSVEEFEMNKQPPFIGKNRGF